MLGDYFFEACVELFAVFVKHHCVGVSVEFFKAEAAVVLFLDLLDGVFEHLPDDVDVFLVH